MGDFMYAPLIDGDSDILSDPASADTFNPVLGVRKSVFTWGGKESVITEGPLADGVKAVLEELREFIESDGGLIEFVDITNGWARLLFNGSCGSCAISASTLLLIEEMVCTAMPEIKGVESIQT